MRTNIEEDSMGTPAPVASDVNVKLVVPENAYEPMLDSEVKDGGSPSAPPPPAASPPSPPSDAGLMDLAALRLGQNFDAEVGVKKLLTTVPVRKPNRSEFVRVRPGEAFQMRTCVVELKEERGEVYLVGRGLWDELAAELHPVLLRLTINRQGVVTLWLLKLPRNDGRSNPWSESAMEAAVRAENTWTSLRANMALGAYEIFTAAGDLPEPTWPTESFEELVKIAFRGKFIADRNHPVLRRLRGEI